MNVTEASLNALLGKHIRDVCPLGYSADTDNHCAHFVSHVLGFQFNTTCRTMVTGTGHRRPFASRMYSLVVSKPEIGTAFQLRCIGA